MFAFSPEFLFLNSKFNFFFPCENSLRQIVKTVKEWGKHVMRATRLDWSREQESGNTCLCGGPSIYLTPLTSGGFLVCVISLQHHVAPPLLVADGHSFFFFKLDPLILKALQIPFFLYSHHREGRRNFFLYHFGGRWFIKLRPLSTIWPVTSVLTTQTLQPWRLPSFSSFALILEKQVASSISRTNNLDPAVVFVTWIAQV